MERHILVVLPHPDDEAFSVSGTLAGHIRQGTPVTYACLTLGEMGRNMGNPLAANRVTLPEIRKAELEESCRSIGIQDLRMLGFHDKTIEFEDRELLVGKIRGLIDELNPSLVITFYPGYSVHPDHDATGAAVIDTVQRIPMEERPVVHCIAFSKGCEDVLGKADIVSDVRPYLGQKLGSILAHSSQFQLNGKLSGKSANDKEVQERFGHERLWTYRFQ